MLHAVIGANYGDEGKGVITDYLSTANTLVVKFNGGAQAGHTVVTPGGQRAVFHQLESGTLKFAPTLLAREFLVNPTLFRDEWPDHCTKVFVDPRARVTLPIDMLINQVLETKRGNDRHGSCGLGINETMVRGETLYNVPAGMDFTIVKDLLHAIMRDWVPLRTEALGIELPPIDVDTYVRKTLEDFHYFRGHTSLVEDVGCINQFEHVVFEGGQGLRLDACSPDFPHVTHSRTGLTNVMPLIEDRPETLTAYYVTRSYLTRHGAGPLPGEVAEHPFNWTGPETNVTNHWQGVLRYAPLDAKMLFTTVMQDLSTRNRPIHGQLAVTCLDHACCEASPRGGADVLSMLADFLPVGLTSHGPTRAHVALTAGVEQCP